MKREKGREDENEETDFFAVIAIVIVAMGLAKASAILDRWVGVFPKDDPRVKEFKDRMIALSDDFYSLQSELLRLGPKGLGLKASQLLKKAARCRQEVETFFGP